MVSWLDLKSRLPTYLLCLRSPHKEEEHQEQQGRCDEAVYWAAEQNRATRYAAITLRIAQFAQKSCEGKVQRVVRVAADSCILGRQPSGGARHG